MCFTSIIYCFIQCLIPQNIGPLVDYPWVDVPRENIEWVESGSVEAKMRMELVRSAKTTLDIISYDQRIDETVGMPLLKTIREAANRGVKVRFFTSWSSSIIKDFRGVVSSYLLGIPTRVPIDFYAINGPKMIGWDIFDGLHEKIMIVDDQKLLISGRGHGDKYLNWLDTGLLMKGPIVHQATFAFGQLWNTLETQSFLLNEKKEHISPEPFFGTIPLIKEEALSLEEKDAKLFKYLKEWALRPPVSVSKSDHLLKVRMLHFDLFNQLRTVSYRENRIPRSYSFDERLEKLSDPIVNEVISKLEDKQTKDFSFYAFVAPTTPRIKQAMVEAAQRGVKIRFYTNGEDAHGSIFPGHFSMGWFVGLSSMIDLCQAGVFIYLHKANLKKEYVHRKLLVTGDTVIMGSHNLSLPSSTTMDEMSFEFKDEGFAKEVNEMFDHDRDNNGSEQLSCDYLKTVLLLHPKKHAISSYFSQLY